MRTVRRSMWIAAVLMLVVAGAACSSDAEPEVSIEFGDGGAPTPEEAAEIVFSAPAALGSAAISGEGVVIDNGEMGKVSLEGTADFESGDGESTSAFETDGGDVGVEWRAVDGTAYFKQSGEFVATGLQDKWVRVDPSEVPEGVEVEGVAEFERGPWVAFLAPLAVATDIVTAASTERVNGVEARGFEAELDVATAIDEGVDATGEPLDDDAVAQLESFVSSFGETARLDVWIDTEGRPVRLEITSRSTDASMSLEFSDFGVEVDVEEPAPDETISLEEFLTATVGDVFVNADPDDFEVEVDGEPVPSDGDSPTDASTTTTEQESSDAPTGPPTSHDPNVGY